MALIDWLKSDAATPPRQVDTAPKKADDSASTLSWNGGQGTAILSGPDGDVTLVWGSDRGAEPRPLSPATYRVRTLRIERADAEDANAHWFISSTGPAQQEIAVTGETPARLDVGTTVHFAGKAQRKGAQLQLGFSVKSKTGRGLSVYRNDGRVATTYEILDRKGGVLAEGPMNYG